MENSIDNMKSWRWNWTEFCGYEEGIKPLDPKTHDLGICFQQLCLQVPVLALLAIISSYYCGKRNLTVFRENNSNPALNLRVIVTICLAILPIIRAYIILTNTKFPSKSNELSKENIIMPRILTTTPKSNLDGFLENENIIQKLKDGLNYSSNIVRLLFPFDNTIKTTMMPTTMAGHNYTYKDEIKLFMIKDKQSSAKPIDYLVAGIEGLAWFVHVCFILCLRKGNIYNPRGPLIIRVLIFLLIVISILLLRSHVNYKSIDDVLPNLSLGFSISVVILLFIYTLTLIPDNRMTTVGSPHMRFNEIGERTALLPSSSSSYVQFSQEQDSNYLGIAMDNVTTFSKLSFHWVSSLMEKGIKKQLHHCDDLFDLPESVSCNNICEKVEDYLTQLPAIRNSDEVTFYSKNVSLLHFLHKCFGWQFYAVGILKFIADCASFMSPIVLNKLLGFIKDKNEPLLNGYLYAALIILSSLISAFCSTHFTFWMSIVGLKIRATIVSLVYRKILYSSNTQLNQQLNFGEIVNFMTTDNERIINSCPSFHTFWSIPFQLAVTLYLLHQQIGISFLAGVAFTIILIPINKLIANKIGRLSTKLMEYKDRRVRLMGEILRGITVIKLNVWEDHFLRNVLKIREKELKYLRGRKYLDALCVYFWATTPVLISIFTFSTFVLLGHEMDAKTVFTSMALLNMLIGPLNAFPWVLNGLTEAWVSIKRIQKMLDLPDMDISSFYSEPPEGVDIFFKDAILSVVPVDEKQNTSEIIVAPSTFADNRSLNNSSDFMLHLINISVKKGQLIGIMGQVGSGKSLFLQCILGEIIKHSGIIAVSDTIRGFGYVKQNPWLQRGTIRDNILFGKTYDFHRYQTILQACALIEDFNSLPEKDLTLVGEAGNTLSGGQKTRISLARAIYADKDIYLLDDVLATLDAKVAYHVFHNAILHLLKGKTRILCTHQVQYLIHADWTIEMSNGKVLKQGKPNDVISNLEDYLLASDCGNDEKDLTRVKEPVKQLTETDEFHNKPLHDEEHSETGTVQLGVYTKYAKAVGYYLILSIFLSMVLMQISKNITDLWLSYWVTHINDTSLINSTITREGKLFDIYSSYLKNDSNYFLIIYGFLAAINSIFTLIRAFIFAYGGLQAATVLHKQLLKVVIKAKLTFYDIQSVGRIINRFSSDTYTADDSLPFIINILFAQFFGLLAVIIVISYGLPWIFLILAPLIPIYHWLQNHYRLTSREIKRLSSNALSPLYAHFNETLNGVTSVRAFRSVSRFKHENELLLETSQKTQFSLLAVSQWLSLRLQIIGVILLAGISIMAVLQHQYDIADPGLIGLAITYTLSITGLLTGVVNAFTETEREMIAVERLKQYLDNITIENIDGDNPPYAWPSQGVIEFKDVELKYRDHLLPSLKGISFITRPAEKIGVVGRTGAGKSSIFTSLFRLIDISSGDILIDNVNIKSLLLSALRSRLAIIPQNPFLFTGTIRENVDPLEQYPDLQIYKTLEKCKLHSLVARLGGLGANLEESGCNLSAGQRQLFCLVRAILHNAKIVCIDEVTANVDQETDKFIQSTIKTSFRGTTVITIAHRIKTIMHCDRVLVMKNGEIIEFEEPNLLIENTDSYFYNLVTQEYSDKE
ncbi:ATP-binding cassette sub-family C member 10 isoform X2 [Prorops nasuta]|uniref:ATP-binding cassette sub-family C member 10 isoform X2 n=1 Tax=Prorops nasuta TaxID=863751 RepID=UPI0034CDA208